MNKTLAFAALDFRLIKPYAKSILLLLVMGIAMGIGFQSIDTLSSFFMMSLVLILSYPFTISEKSGMDMLYSTLSLSRKTVVIGRYLFVLFLVLIFAAITFVSSFILSGVIGDKFILAKIGAVLCLLSGIAFFLAAFQYPIYFKYGYTKARFIALIPMFAIFLIIVQLPVLSKMLNWDLSLEDLYTLIMSNPLLMYAMPIAFGLAAGCLSCLLSCRIYTRRDI